jgi:fructose-1,6-bisphosphatase I
MFHHQGPLLTITTRLAAENSPSGTPMPTGGLPKQMRKKKLQTFLRYLEVECWKRQDLRGLEPVLQAVASACKQINRIVQRAQTDDVYGVAVDSAGNPLSDNVQGEVQQKLDVLCNTIMLQAFCGSGREIHSVASEEEDKPRCCSDVMVRT